MSENPPMAIRIPLEEVLAATPLFGSLDRRHQQRLAEAMTTRRFDAGTVILRQGASAVALYMILEGEVEVTRSPEGGDGPSDGPPVVLARLAVGEVFGEMALLDDEARSTHVTARTPTTCALLTRWEFQEELRRTSDLAIALLRVLSRRLRQLDERVARDERKPTS